MRKTLLPLLVLSCAGFAQIDTSILKAGSTWKYEYGRESSVTGSLQSSFKGTALFRIDTVRKSGPDSVFYSVSRLDSGISTDYPGSGTGTTLTRAVYLLMRGDWQPVTPDQSEYVPRFAFSGLFARPFRWAVLGGDTLRFNQREAFTPIHTCVPTAHRYLESVGLINYTYSAHCGITSTEMHYHLILHNGKPFKDSDLNVLPLTSDFAPYALGRYWEYRVVEIRTEWQPMSGSHATTLDSLLWSFQVVGLGSDGDSLIVLEAHVQGRKGMRSPVSRGDTVDVRYLDTTLFRGGSAYPSWDPKGEGGSRIVFDHHAAFQPFYNAHGAVLDHLPPGTEVRDTLMDGQIRKFIVEKDKESKGKDTNAFVQEIGLVRKYYAGFFQVMPSSGSLEWSGEILLLATGSRPVGMPHRRGNPLTRGSSAAVPGMRAGAVWVDGSWFGADGRRSVPSR